MSKQYRFECVIDLPWVNPVRIASSKQEFIDKILEEYNASLNGLVELKASDIRKDSITFEEVEDD